MAKSKATIKSQSPKTLADPFGDMPNKLLANGETGELLPPKHTTEEAFTPDTNADPEGAERRANRNEYPVFLMSEFVVDQNGDLRPNSQHVQRLYSTYLALKDSPMKGVKEKDWDAMVVACADQLGQFGETTSTTANGNPRRPCNGVINLFAYAAAGTVSYTHLPLPTNREV